MPDVFGWLSAFFEEYGDLLLEATIETLIIVTVATIVAYLFGILIAMITKITEPGSLHPLPALNAILGWIINMGRSIPYIILMVALIPLTRLIVGTGIGAASAIVPLTIAAIPFVARMVENSFSEVSPGRIEAGRAFGASTLQILLKVFIVESLPSIIRGAAITYITLIGYSAIAGAFGAGGLGDVAVRFGYQRYQTEVMIATIVILIILVQIVQSLSDLIARRLDKR
jgi:D-methionine transport system permease protein